MWASARISLAEKVIDEKKCVTIQSICKLLYLFNQVLQSFEWRHIIWTAF